MNWAIRKLQVYFENPVEYRFLATAFINIPDEVKKDIMNRHEKINSKIMPIIMDGIDYSHFRKDIDVNKVLNFIIAAIEAIGNKYLEMYKQDFDEAISNMDKIIEDFKEYIEMLKYGVYER